MAPSGSFSSSKRARLLGLVVARELRSTAAACLAAAFGLALSPLPAAAQQLEGDAEFWELPLVSFDDSLGARGVPDECWDWAAEAEFAQASEVSPQAPPAALLENAACRQLLQFGPGGGPLAAPSWVSQAWAWGTDHWMMLSAPIPLAFLAGGGGGGGGGGGAPAATDSGGGEGSGATGGGEPVRLMDPVDGSNGRVAPVPEPSSWILMAFGAGVVGLALRRSARDS